MVFVSVISKSTSKASYDGAKHVPYPFVAVIVNQYGPPFCVKGRVTLYTPSTSGVTTWLYPSFQLSVKADGRFSSVNVMGGVTYTVVTVGYSMIRSSCDADVVVMRGATQEPHASVVISSINIDPVNLPTTDPLEDIAISEIYISIDSGPSSFSPHADIVGSGSVYLRTRTQSTSTLAPVDDASQAVL
jgi:hypothetical protein